MNPRSLKKSGIFFSIIFLVSIFLPLDSSFSLQKAFAAATPVGTSETAIGYDGNIGIVSDFYPAVMAYPGTPFPEAMTNTGTAADPLPQGVLETYTLTENTGTSIKFQVTSKPTKTAEDGYDAGATDEDDEFGQVGIAVYIKKDGETEDKYVRINDGADPYFFTGEKDADETPLIISRTGLFPNTTYNVKFVGVYYYESFDPDLDDGHIVPKVFTVTTGAGDAEIATPTGDLASVLGYEGNISGGTGNSALSGPTASAYPHTALPSEFTDAPTLTDPDCAFDNGDEDEPLEDDAVAKSCEGVKVEYSLEDVTPTSFKIKYVVSPTTDDPEAETGSDLKELYFWTYIKKDGEADTAYQRLANGGSPYFAYDYTEGGEGTGVIEVGTLLTGTIYDIQILGLYKYNEFDVTDGHILPAKFPITTEAAATAEEAAAAAAAAAGGPTATYKSAAIHIYCFSFTEKPALSLAGCGALLLKDVLFPLIAGIIYIIGMFFDIMANFSIGSEAYDASVTFIQAGWTLVRDFSNILFIVALVYLAFGIIFDLHGVNVKKSIASLIIMALLVNFSLFFTKMIIDTSNILARIFYTQIQVDGLDDLELTDSSLKTVNISRGLISSFDPQQMISPNTQILLQEQLSKGADQNRMLLILYFMACIMLVVAGWALLVTGLNFVQRTISLWLAMIFSPFAFVSFAFPFGLKGLKRIGWDSWIKDLLCWCFYAPLFFFFIYIIIAFASSDFLQGFVKNASSYGIFEFLVYLIFPFVVIITLLIYSKNLAKSLGCEGADALVGAGTKLAAGAVGVGMMVASGGASAIMRRTAGASAANKLKNDDELKKAAAGDTAALASINRRGYAGLSDKAKQEKARKEVERLQKNATKSYDFRQSKVGGALGGALGVNMNTGAGVANWMTKGKVGFNTSETTGGYMGENDRRIAKDKAFIDSLGIDQTEINKIKNGTTDPANPTAGVGKGNTPRNNFNGRKTEDIEEELETKKETAQAEIDQFGSIQTPHLADDIRDASRELRGRKKETEKLEKGYTKKYAEFLEREKKPNTSTAAAGFGPGGNIRAQWNNLFSGANMRRTGGQAALGAAVGGAIAGPLGMGIGGIVGAMKGFTQDLRGGISNWFRTGIDNQTLLKNTWFEKYGTKTDLTGAGIRDRMASNFNNKYYKPGKYTDNYKPVWKEFFSFFEKLSKGGIEIKGGNDHGGGKDHKKDDHAGGGSHGGGH